MNLPNNNEIKFELVPTQEENLSLLVRLEGKTQALHSRAFPSKEANIMRSELEPKEANICIVLGIGVGYHLIPLKEYAPLYKHVILIDILPSARENISSSHICAFLLHEQNISIVCGLSPDNTGKELSRLINLEENSKIKVLAHNASMRIFKAYYEAVKNEITSLLNSKAGNMATMRAFGRQYFRNCIKNLNIMPMMFSVKDFFDKFTGLPALVITSGPSLEGSMRALKEAEDRVFIIAVDSALPVCAAFGFRPDFVVTVDPQAYISEHLMGFWNEPLRLITSISAWQCRFGSDDSRWSRYSSLNSHPFSQLVEEFKPETVGSINSRSGSVAGDALLFAMQCGFSRIAFAGLDSAFINGAIYSRGTAYQRRYAAIFQNRFLSTETQNFNYIRKSALRENGLSTRKVFSQYRKSIEKLLEEKAFSADFFHIKPPAGALKGSSAASIGEFLGTQCKEKIEKTSIFSKITDAGKPLGEKINFPELRAILAKKEIFNRLITASLGDNKMINKPITIFTG